MGGGEPVRPERIRYREFAALCTELTILPGIALDSDNVAKAIESRDRIELRRVLESEF